MHSQDVRFVHAINPYRYCKAFCMFLTKAIPRTVVVSPILYLTIGAGRSLILKENAKLLVQAQVYHSSALPQPMIMFYTVCGAVSYEQRSVNLTV